MISWGLGARFMRNNPILCALAPLSMLGGDSNGASESIEGQALASYFSAGGCSREARSDIRGGNG